MRVFCPQCGQQSGPFVDPRVKSSASAGLLLYRCAACGHKAALLPLLRAVDELTVRVWLMEGST